MKNVDPFNTFKKTLLFMDSTLLITKIAQVAE